jgi:Uma2 family endonuclease
MYNDSVAAVYEEEIGFGPPAVLGPYREADYFDLPDDPRCELVYGVLVLTPSPNLRHQRTLGALYRLLHEFASAHGGEALLAPLDVRLATHSVVQPDLLYVSPERSEILRERVFGAPDLAVEILSPGTARRDRGAKLQLYAESGVIEYWIVDPDAETIEFPVNDERRFRVEVPRDGRYRSPASPGLELELTTIWSQVTK